MKLLKFIDQAIERMTIILLVSGVALMLSFSLMTIVLRWFESSFLWLDPLVRHLVFLCTFLGGVMATGRGSHIGIDIVSKTLEVQGRENWLVHIKRMISLVSFVTLVWLIQASYQFMTIELEYGRASFLGIHSGVLVGIIPAGFALIAYRFFYLFIASFSRESLEEQKAKEVVTP